MRVGVGLVGGGVIFHPRQHTAYRRANRQRLGARGHQQPVALRIVVVLVGEKFRKVVDEAGNYMASDLLKVPYLYAACVPGARALIFMTPKGLALVPDLVAEKMFIEIRPHEVTLGLTKILRRTRFR